MSHVDEGTLHSYLDGELPAGERGALDAHLAQCADCRAMLAEERALLERASALLGTARPVERPAPPFEQIRPTRRRSPWRVRMPLAWAASIALAVGLGYYLHAPESADRAAPTQPVTVAERRPEPALRTEDKASAAVRQQPAPPFLQRRPAAPADELGRQQQAARADSPARGESGAAGVAAIAPQMALRNTTPAPAAAAPQRLSDSLQLSQAYVTVEGAPARAAAPVSAPTRARVVPRDLVATTWPVISRGTAASLLGEKPVGLPGLATREIRRSPGADGTVVVEQALDSTTVIRIFQRPVDVVAAYDSTRSERTNRLARFVGRLRVEISGPLSPDSLNKLLEQVEPLP